MRDGRVKAIDVAGWSRHGSVLEAEIVTTLHCTGGANRGDEPIPTLYVVEAPEVRTLKVTHRVVDQSGGACLEP